MSKRLKFYNIDLEYIENLRKLDNKIPDTSQQNKKTNRKFIGILLKIDEANYVAPLSSPKKKHLSMKDGVDFIKIDNGNLGIINFNNMFPVPNHLISEMDISKENDSQYKILLTKQLSWCNEVKNKKNILKTSKLLYNLISINKLPERVKERCCNFKLLEEKCLEYLEIQKFEKKFEINKENYEFIIENFKEMSESAKDGNYNCLTGNQILVKSHSSEDRKWIPASIVKEEKIDIKDNEKSVKGLLTNIEEGKLYTKPIEYYNISQLNITKEIEQKFVPMKENRKAQEIEKVKDKGIER